MCGDYGRQDEEATKRDIDGVECVGEDEERNADGQLDHVIQHQVDEKNKARFHLEDLN